MPFANASAYDSYNTQERSQEGGVGVNAPLTKKATRSGKLFHRKFFYVKLFSM